MSTSMTALFDTNALVTKPEDLAVITIINYTCICYNAT